MKHDAKTGGWFKSSFCNAGANECVEVAIGPDEIRVRDSKDRAAGQLTFTRAEWTAFLAGARAGEFDPS